MMRFRTIVLICAGSLFLLPAVATAQLAQETAARRILWKKVPIAIHLSVGEERLVHFAGPVSVGVPNTIASRLRTQTVNGTVYWLASRPFSSTRIAVRELDSGRYFLFDVNATAGASDSRPITIMTDAPRGDGVSADGRGNDGHFDFVSLTRFAAQQLYAPARLLTALPGAVRVPVDDEAIPLVPGGAVEATPLLSWRAGTRYITAVKLVNHSPEPQVLDPRALRGQWLSATFQHARLLPEGSEADTTTVYLVSAQPFDASGLN